jgi:acyl carrier protein
MSFKMAIRNFIVDSFLFGEDEGLSDDTSFLKQGIIDSTGVMQLVSFIQDQYNLTVDDEDLTPENLDSIRKVSAFIERKIGRVAAGNGVQESAL